MNFTIDEATATVKYILTIIVPSKPIEEKQRLKITDNWINTYEQYQSYRIRFK